MRLGSAFEYKVILLDTRSNKDKKGSIYGDFLGSEQWNWLMSEVSFINQSIPNLVIIGSSIQIFPTDKFMEESWSEFPLARERLLRVVTLLSRVTRVLLLSGDVHGAEFLQARCGINHGYGRSMDSINLLEFTSSGLSHSVTRVFSHR